MGVRYLSQGFAGTPVLPLPGSLLNQFIGDHEPCVAPVRVKTSAIGIRPLPFKHGRKTTTVAAIRVVLLDGRIQVSIGLHGFPANTDGRAASGIPERDRTLAIGKTAILKRGAAVESAMRVFFTRHFDHAAELQAKFGGVSCRPDIQRLEFFDVYRLREGRRAVVIKWDPVDHVGVWPKTGTPYDQLISAWR